MPSFAYVEEHIRAQASGNDLRIPIYRFEGEGSRRVHIQANIHGPEVAGVAACYELVKLLQAEAVIHGQITIVPSVNPVALDLKFNGLQVGYADPNEYTVGNFNRIYQMLVKDRAEVGPETEPDDPAKVVVQDFVAQHLDSPIDVVEREYKASLMAALADVKHKRGRTGLRFGLHLGLSIQSMVHQADYLIDLHTDARALYYGYSFAPCLATHRLFGVPYMIEIDPDEFDGVLDEAFLIPWIKLQRAFAAAGREIAWDDLGKEAHTLELGNADEVDAEAAKQDARRIVNVLRHKRILNGEPVPPAEPFFHCRAKHRDNYYAPTGGLVFWHAKLGQRVAEGQLVATILRLRGEGPNGLPVETPVTATAEGVLLNLSRSQVVHQGIQMFSILTHLREAGQA
jgi:predicted deacylase